MYKKEDICAIVISYNCDEIIISNICALKPQVAEILVIDNGSFIESIHIIKSLETEPAVHILWNDTNIGISYAISQGLQYAKMKKYKLVITMDQDTILSENAVAFMLETINCNQGCVSVGPTAILDTNTKQDVKSVEYLITSGNLVRIDAYEKVCLLEPNLFIDSVDFDISFQLISGGGLLFKDNRAKMKHTIGECCVGHFLGMKVRYSSHSPLRHYYIARNHYYIIRRYSKERFFTCLKNRISYARYILEIVLIHKNKREELKMIRLGVKDAKANRYGKFKGE